MDAVLNFLYRTTGIIFLIGGLYFMTQFSDMEENRSKVLIEDEVRKSSIELNLSASAGNRELTWEETYTTIMTCPLDVSVIVNGHQIPLHDRKQAERKQKDLVQYIVNGTYETSYSFGSDGKVSEIHFDKMEE